MQPPALLPLLLTLVQAPGDAARDAAYDALSKLPRETPVVKVAAVVGPSVVYIETESVGTVQAWPFGSQQVLQQGAGTGVVVHEDGYVVTNFHVVRGARRITISFAGDPIVYVAELLSSMQNEDLALLRITSEGSLDREDLRAGLASGIDPASVQPGESNEVRVRLTPRRYPAVRMGTSADLMIGEPVVAIGNPHGQEHTVSDGIVSGLHRAVQTQDLNFQNLIQTDASINLGNSGGPLLNIHGELIGINTVMHVAAENIGFAIPVDRVREVLEQELIPNAHRAWIGVDLVPEGGSEIAFVVPGSPAEAAGLCAGDRIVTMAGRPVTSDEDWLLASLQLTPGELVLLKAERAGAGPAVDLKLVPWARADGVLWRHLGLRVQALHTRRSGDLVRVLSVRGEGPAAVTGLLEGDILPAVRPAGTTRRSASRIRSGQDLAAVVERMERGEDLEVEVLRLASDLSGEATRLLGSIRKD